MLFIIKTIKKLVVYTSFVLLFIPQTGYADKLQTPTNSPLPVLPEVQVEATRIAPITGTTIIDKEMIDALPKSNGNLTEILQTVPGVQFSESYNNSATGGEIKPPEISISGGRTEDNNYILDGAGNNSLLDPVYTNTNNENNVPGHSQELFVLDHLIDSIKVFRANVPVQYGGFSGGVIETETLDPGPEFSGQLAYNTTRSVWGKFHIASEDEETFHEAANSDNQPHFKKSRISSTLNIPINETTGVLLDYARLESKIPLKLFVEEKNQYRENENFFLKCVSTPKTNTEVKLTALYSPYKENRYIENTKNSDYQLIGGGWKISGQWTQDTQQGKFTSILNFQESFNSREASSDWYSWRVSPTKNWGKHSSLEGGYGDIKKEQKTLSTNFHFESKPIYEKALEHIISTGSEVSYSRATFDRTEKYTKNIAWADENIICIAGDSECITGEQYIRFKTIYPQDLAKASILNLGFYLEDKITIERFTLTPGIRLSYNNFQKNTDLAPRFVTNIDLWNNRKTIITGGVGRYYSSNLLTLRLEEQKEPYKKYSKTSYLDSWTEKLRTSFDKSRTGSLSTPYSNEWSLGVQQFLLGGQAELLYINRHYKKQIISVTLKKDPDGYRYREWHNSGKRKYEEISLGWQKQWEKMFFSFNISWQKVKSNSSSYADNFSEDQVEENADYVWYNNRLILREELPPNNYNRPIKASIIYSTKLSHNFSFTNTTNFKGRYKALVVDGDDPTGVFDAYSVTSIPSSVVFDWKLAWTSPQWSQKSLTLTLDVLNVFDKINHFGPASNEYLLGRQFWAGLEFRF